MTKLHRLYAEAGQSPWLDNLTRRHVHDGTLARLVSDGILGVTANPTIIANAILGSSDYDEQFSSLIAAGSSLEEAYWELVVTDVCAALSVLRPVFDETQGTDGFVSVEIAPELARDTRATMLAARALHERVRQPNLLVKIPATSQGVPAVEAMVGEGRSINVTLIFSLTRYFQVIGAYLDGLETFAAAGGDLSTVRGVASFFVSRVDTEVDRRLDAVGTGRVSGMWGEAAIAQAKLAYRLFAGQFSGQRWERLAAQGAHVQRLLWASTSTKNPAYFDTRYVDELIGPDTVNTMSQRTIAAFEDHGAVTRSVDVGVEEAAETMRQLAGLGVDMNDVGLALEEAGVAGFHTSFQRALDHLASRTRHPSTRTGTLR